MKKIKLKSQNGFRIEGPWLIKPDLFNDNRGFFYESWNEEFFNSIVGTNIKFLQDNHSCSKKGVLRGLHYQLPPNSQGKLVRCIKGAIYDVAVDLRKNSPTFLNWTYAELSSKNKKQFWIPSGFAHGFLALSDRTEVLYKATGYWSKKDERSIHWNDPTLSINWPINSLESSKIIISEKDNLALKVNEIIDADFF